jgi:acetyl esterase/lipase
VFYPKSGQGKKDAGEAAALIYFHGGGYTVGTVDEFENGLRILAEESGCQVYAVEYRLAPEWRFPTQLDEYVTVTQWLQGEGGKASGVHPDRVMGGGDSAGGNMTAAVSLRLRDEGKKPLAAQLLLYPEARLPFDTPAASENNSGLYLECKSTVDPHMSLPLRIWELTIYPGNGIFSFADHYLPRGTAPGHPYVSPGMQDLSLLKNLPPAAVFTCGFDPLRDVGVEYSSKLKQAGNKVEWKHFDTLTHGFLQFAPWSEEAKRVTVTVAVEMKRLAYGE